MSILVIAEHDNDELKGSTLNTITAAKEIDSDIELLVAGFSCEAVVEKACEIPVISKVVVADKQTYKNFLAENIGALVAKIGSNYSHILTPATSNLTPGYGCWYGGSGGNAYILIDARQY